MLHVSKVENGLMCGCVCAGCGGSLVARNNVKNKKIWHFAHLTKECANAQESALHRIAKEVIAKMKVIKLPEYKGLVVGDFVTDGWIAEVEYNKLQGIRPDIAFTKGLRMLFVEIAVTNPVSADKREYIERLRQATLEFDLKPFFERNQDFSINQVRDFLEKCESKWIFNEKLEEKYKASLVKTAPVPVFVPAPNDDHDGFYTMYAVKRFYKREDRITSIRFVQDCPIHGSYIFQKCKKCQYYRELPELLGGDLFPRINDESSLEIMFLCNA